MRGIDHQIMITKATELSSEKLRMDKKSDILADQAALRGRQLAEQDKNRPLAATKVEGSKIRENETKDRQGSGGEQENHEAEAETTVEPGKELLQLPVERGKITKKRNYTFDATI